MNADDPDDDSEDLDEDDDDEIYDTEIVYPGDTLEIWSTGVVTRNNKAPVLDPSKVIGDLVEEGVVTPEARDDRPIRKLAWEPWNRPDA